MPSDSSNRFLAALSPSTLAVEAPQRARQSSQASILTWRSVLAKVDGTRPRPIPAGTELLYGLDVAASRSSGSLEVVVLQRRPMLRGEGMTKPIVLPVGADLAESAEDESDRRVLGLLAGASDPIPTWPGGARRRSTRISAWVGLGETLVPLLCETGRFVPLLGGEPGEPLRWEPAGAWELWLELTDSDSAFSPSLLQAELRRGDERLSPENALLVSGGVVVAKGTVSPLSGADAGVWLGALGYSNLSHETHVPQREAAELVLRLLQMRRRPRLSIPDRLRPEVVTFPAQPVLQALREPGPEGAILLAVRFRYGVVTVNPDRDESLVPYPSGRRVLERDLAAEAQALRGLDELLPAASGGSRAVDPRSFAELARTLLHEGWSVEVEGRRVRSGGSPRLAVTSGIDWLELGGAVEFEGGTAALDAVLRASRQGETWVALSDGSIGLLPEDWLARSAPLLRLAKSVDAGLRFHSSQALLVDELLEGDPKARLDEGFTSLRQRIRSFTRVKPQREPKGFSGSLRSYQKEALGWFRYLRDVGFGGCLADDMGLGKTVQALALVQSRVVSGEATGPALVVTPRSLIHNWLEEAERFVPNLFVHDHSAPGRGGEDLEAMEHADIVLVTYGTLRRDAEAMAGLEFDYVILDEAHAIKNAATATAAAVARLRARHRLALTGTPVQNHMGELWSLLEFLNPGLLGTSPAFQKALDAAPEQGVSPAVARVVRPFILRRTKEQVAPELPKRQEQTLLVDLSPAERAYYEKLRTGYRGALVGKAREQGMSRVRMQVLEALLRLRQAACHPGLVDKARAKESSTKLDTVLARIAEVGEEGHKSLVFSQFTSLLSLLRRHLDEAGVPYAYLDGQTRDRREPVARFQEDPACKLFLVSLKAGGLGLNLTAAEYVFLLDPWWNPAIEAQAIDRAHRIGQTRPVLACRIVARGTVEEKILELQGRKREMAAAVLGEDAGLLGKMTADDLERLLSD